MQPNGKNKNSNKNKRNNRSKYISEAVIITFFVVSFVLATISSILGTLLFYKKYLRDKKSKISYTDVESGRRRSSDTSRTNSTPNDSIRSEYLSVKKSTRNPSPVRYVRCWNKNIIDEHYYQFVLFNRNLINHYCKLSKHWTQIIIMIAFTFFYLDLTVILKPHLLVQAGC